MTKPAYDDGYAYKQVLKYVRELVEQGQPKNVVLAIMDKEVERVEQNKALHDAMTDEQYEERQRNLAYFRDYHAD